MSLFDVDLPAGRRWLRVGDAYEVTRKPRGLDISTLPSIPFAPMEAIPQGGAFAPDYAPRAPGEIRSGTYFERGDILVAKITPSFENGKQALTTALPADFGFATTEVIPLRPVKERNERRLLFFYLLHPDVRHYVTERMEGTTGRQRIPEEVLLDLPFPDFEPEEQTTIADALEIIQRLKAIETQSMQTVQILKRAAMQTLFTRGLRGEAQKHTEIGPMPESWKLTPCNQIFKLTSGRKRPDTLSAAPNDERPFPVLGGNGVMGFSNKWYLDATQTLVVGRVGEYCGAVHIASGKVWITDNALYAKEWLKNDAKLRFVGAFLEYFDLNRFRHMAGQPLVTQGMINEHCVPLPDIDEQCKVIAIVDAIDSRIDLHRRKCAILAELSTALLHKLLTGEIRTHELAVSRVLHDSTPNNERQESKGER